MNDDLKYIIVDHCFPIVFVNYLSHADVAQAFTKTYITGAGFLGKNVDGNLYTYGESVSLGIKSNSTDARIIQKMLQEKQL